MRDFVNIVIRFVVVYPFLKISLLLWKIKSHFNANRIYDSDLIYQKENKRN